MAKWKFRTVRCCKNVSQNFIGRHLTNSIESAQGDSLSPSLKIAPNRMLFCSISSMAWAFCTNSPCPMAGSATVADILRKEYCAELKRRALSVLQCLGLMPTLLLNWPRTHVRRCWELRSLLPQYEYPEKPKSLTCM